MKIAMPQMANICVCDHVSLSVDIVCDCHKHVLPYNDEIVALYLSHQMWAILTKSSRQQYYQEQLIGVVLKDTNNRGVKQQSTITLLK